jgi:hypothetical protein
MDLDRDTLDRDTGVQAEKPVPPWERPGCFRLDCEPYRGELLLWLACASCAFGAMSLLTPYGWIIGPAGILFGLAARHLARRRLARMKIGLMDPNGEPDAVQAASLARLGFWACLAGTVIWGSANLLFGPLSF